MKWLCLGWRDNIRIICRYDVTGGCKKIFGFSGEWKQRRIDRCRTGRSGKGRCLAGIPESWIWGCMGFKECRWFAWDQSGSKGGTSTVQKVFTDNPFDEAGNLKPNIKYQTGEFKYNYETDANGRISNWNTDNLQLTERDGRLNYNSDSLGKIEGDHAGHLAGDRFGGSPELDNIVSQSQNVNLSQYKKIENQWAKAISEGKEVTVNIDIKYDGDGFRPIEFNVEYTIDGDFFSQSILN